MRTQLFVVLLTVCMLVALSGCASTGWSRAGVPAADEATPAVPAKAEAIKGFDAADQQDASGYFVGRDGVTYQRLSFKDVNGKTIEIRDENPGEGGAQVSVWYAPEGRIYQRNLDASKFPVGSWYPTPKDWPFAADVQRLAVLSGWCSGGEDVTRTSDGVTVCMSEDTSGYNAGIMADLGIAPPPSGVFRPTLNDCSGPAGGEMPAVLAPKPRVVPKTVAVVAVSDASPELDGKGVFLFDSTQLTPEAENLLLEHLAPIAKGTALVVETGCDHCGSDVYNDALSQRRAAAMKTLLEGMGYRVVRTVAHGEKLAKVMPEKDECNRKTGFPRGAEDRFLTIALASEASK